jgi:RsiW-degrading membrane proteinase PrsW (M82 family)
MGEQYYVRIRGRVSGPFDYKQLKVLAQQHRLNRTHEISDDTITWYPASDRTELFTRLTTQGVALKEDIATVVKEIPIKAETASELRQATPLADSWYVSVNGEKAGPFSTARLRSDASVGILSPDVLVWTEGMSDWATGSSIPGLFSPVHVPQPVVKPRPLWLELFPVFRLFNDRSWSLPWVQCLFVALLFPLLVFEFYDRDKVGLVNAAIAFSLYFSLIWTAFFHWCIRPNTIGGGRMLVTWLLTGTFGVLGAMLVEMLSIPVFGQALEASQRVSLLTKIIGWSLAVGLVEETAKLAAIVLTTANMKFRNPPRTCAFMGVVSGLAFGTIEAVFYTYSYAKGHSAQETSENTYGVLFLLLITRWISLPLLHATWTGIAGYFVGLAKNPGPYRWRWLFLGLIIVSILHGIYDVGAADPAYSSLTVAAAAASLAMFVGYLRSEERLVELISRYRPTVM